MKQEFDVEIAKSTSHTFAIMIEFICKKSEIANENASLVSHPKLGDGWFPLEVDHVYEETGLTHIQQKGAISIAERLGMLECKNFSLPCRRHLRVHNLDFHEIKRKSLIE